jgi:GT2 family glycosyltransferase
VRLVLRVTGWRIELFSTYEGVVLIVNYRTADLTIDALVSLGPETGAATDTQVVVVDNASEDGSYERISAAVAAQGWGSWATVLGAPSNGGFSSGNNVGIAWALERWSAPRYVHLLNPDTVVRPGALAHLVAFMDANAPPARGSRSTRRSLSIQIFSSRRWPGWLAAEAPNHLDMLQTR